MRVHHREAEIENHDRGLDHDLPRLLHRRGLLRLALGAGLAGSGLMTLAACANGMSPGSDQEPASGQNSPEGTSDTANGELPEETAGPYPSDGSNGANILDESGVIRSDITASFGSSTTAALGVPLSITMTLLDFANGKSPLKGAAVYLWHCDREGRYSMYSSGVTAENYLRGVQATDSEGRVQFRSIFPACYSGRWPHIHFEVYPSLARATSSTSKIATSQLALPEDACRAVYASEGYEQSRNNLSRVSLQSDRVFSDGYDLQIPAVIGSPTAGYALTFTCAV